MQQNINILIADDVHPTLMEGLDRLGLKYSYQPDVTHSEIGSLLPQYNALIVRSKINLDRAVLQQCQQLIWIGRAGSGMDNIDLEAARELNIQCFNAGAGNRDAVGEHAVGLLLNLSKNIHKSGMEVAKGVWDREGNRGFEIKGKTIGIIGFGNTGSTVAEKLSGFGARILAYDKYKTSYGSHLVVESDYYSLLNESDILSFHVPLTEETRHWIDRDFIAGFNRPKVLLNLSRGGIMNTSAVLEGLESGMIRAFGTDVLENEQLEKLSVAEQIEFKKLASLPQVIITPHIGGWSHESYLKISELLLVQIEMISREKDTLDQQITRKRLYVG